MISIAVLAAAHLLAISPAAAEGADAMCPTVLTVLDFAGEDEARHWMVVNDGVMGGRSRSRLTVSDDQTGVFEGTVSLEAGGGFASVRTYPGDYGLGGCAGLVIRALGDGRRYRLRLRTDDAFDGVAYQATFETRAGEWVEVSVPFDRFVASFRGRILDDVPPLDPAKVRQMGFMIADKQQGEFRLELDWVKAYGDPVKSGTTESASDPSEEEQR